jgi:copper(I)-binding protein
MSIPFRMLLPSLAIVAAHAVHAQAAAPVAAEGVWARATVQGQRSSGVFMTLVAREPVTLVRIATPVAGVAEVHEMKMEGDVMRMRAVDALPLAPKQPLALKPGGYHLMLQELKAPLRAGTSIPLTLTFRTAGGQDRELALQVPVSVAAPPEAGAATTHGMHKP